MVTSDEERQGSETGATALAANDRHAPEAAPATAETSVTPSQSEVAEPVDDEPADEAPKDGTPADDGPLEKPIAEEPPAAIAEPPLPLVPDPTLTATDPFNEDEATGRRVESLLAEAPDGDPEGPHPERGAPTAEPMPAPNLEGFQLTPGPEIEDLAFEDEAPAPSQPIASITDPSFFDPPAAPQPARPLRGKGMDRVGPIVAFDFDGTLTVRDSFTAFLKWREGSARYHAEMASLAPAALKYLFDRDPGKLKAAAVKRFLAGLPREVLNAEAMEFAASAAPMLFRPDALRAWRRYRQDGARLLIVTASPENLVAPFARGLGADMLIATQLIFDQDDRVQGGLLGDNCRGPVKVKRIKEALGEDTVLAAAYGDTDGDWEMLEMAEQQFMRLFVGVPGKTGGAN